MDAGISSVRFPKCFDVDSQARPLHRSTRKELSDSDLNNLADHYLKEGERLCYKVSERGSYEWFAYGAAAEPAGTSGFEGTFAVQFKAGLAIIFGLGSLAVILDALWRYAFESTKLPPPADEKAEGERERAEAERPTSVEVPEIETIIVEDPHSQGPFGAKSLGEPVIIPTAAAIAAAVSEAVGAAVREIPIRPEQVLELIGKGPHAADAL